MNHPYHALAVDLGASSGRMILSAFDGETVSFVDEYRMENGFLPIKNGLFWDVHRLYSNILHGLQYFKSKGQTIDSIGIDSWGLDTVFLDRDGLPTGLSRCYRDKRNEVAFSELSKIISPQEMFRRTGISPGPLNTVYQMFAARNDAALQNAGSFLFIPDYLVYLLTGVAATELSIASTSQMLSLGREEFDRDLMETLGVGALGTPEIRTGYGERGRLARCISEQTGYDKVPVMNINSHDTGSAVSLSGALPKDHLYMNSGTIVILAAIQEQACITDKAWQNGMTNERLTDGGVRSEIWTSGLFFINQCMSRWQAEGKEYSWDQITEMARKERSCEKLLDLTDPDLQQGGNMPELVRKQCRNQKIPVPETDAAVARLVYESLAGLFQSLILQYEDAADRSYPVIDMVGGGSRNAFLNELIRERTGKEIRIGVTEATCFGNVLGQLQGAGELKENDAEHLVREMFQKQ